MYKFYKTTWFQALYNYINNSIDNDNYYSSVVQQGR